MTREDQRDLRAEILALQEKDHHLTQAEIARQSGVNASRLNQYLKGSYGGDNENVEAELIRWIDAYHNRRIESQALPSGPNFVATPSSKRVMDALRYAQIASDISVVYGGAGLGKTKSLEQYQASNPNVWIATMTPATATVVPALEEVAESLGIEASGGAARIQRAIIRRMKNTMGLLVIDEAQHLGVQALDGMRALHDATGVGMALVGNESVYARLTGGNRAAYLDRLYSRIGKRVALRKPTKDDVKAVVKAWEIGDTDCHDALLKIATKPGGLRGLTKTLRLSSMYAAGRGERVSFGDIQAAWRELGGER